MIFCGMVAFSIRGHTVHYSEHSEGHWHITRRDCTLIKERGSHSGDVKLQRENGQRQRIKEIGDPIFLVQAWGRGSFPPSLLPSQPRAERSGWSEPVTGRIVNESQCLGRFSPCN